MLVVRLSAGGEWRKYRGNMKSVMRDEVVLSISEKRMIWIFGKKEETDA